MGTTASKPAPLTAPSLDMGKATFTGDYVQGLANSAAGVVRTANTQLASATSTSSFRGILASILGVVALVCLSIVLYDAFAPVSWPNIFFDKRWTAPPPPPTSTPPVSPTPVNNKPPVSGPVGTTPPAPPPTVFSSLMSYFGDSNSTGDFLPKGQNAQTSLSIQGNKVPLSSQKDGAYSMQWWMFVKDWNYGYGKQKSILKRPDPVNPAILNPHISLHPTDNSMQISVSVFPSKEGGASKSEPAPAGNSSSTDDVFVCDVPDIPLQSWFSVSVSVFGRNLDVYINGNLVKSCFLSGVPKPATGDILLTPDGGFSGKMCNFYHYARMLSPMDAMTFYSAGTACKNDSGTENTSSATGYSVKFGVYDTLGKEVQEYTF